MWIFWLCENSTNFIVPNTENALNKLDFITARFGCVSISQSNWNSAGDSPNGKSNANVTKSNRYIRIVLRVSVLLLRIVQLKAKQQSISIHNPHCSTSEIKCSIQKFMEKYFFFFFYCLNIIVTIIWCILSCTSYWDVLRTTHFQITNVEFKTRFMYTELENHFFENHFSHLRKQK